MGISFKGRTPDWQYWVFDIDGRDWVAINQSTLQPLSIQFQGRYQNWPASLPLTKEGGFDILSSTTTGTSDIDEKRGTVEWLWNGTRYKSSWAMFGLEEIIAAYEDSPAVWNYHLKFIGQVPYEGPTGGGVGTGVTSQATIEISNQITPSAQLSTAAPEQQSPMPMAVTSRPVTSGIATPTAIQAAQSEQITPSAQLTTAAPEQQSPMPMPVTSQPVTSQPVTSQPVAAGVAVPAAQTGLTFLGHTPTYNQWVFDVSGRRLVAVNLSRQSPLQLKFSGNFSDQPLTLMKTSGFDITSSTGTTIEWVWQGNRYKSVWMLAPGDDAAEEEADLDFGPAIPYEGPAGGAVGTGLVSQAVVDAQTAPAGTTGTTAQTMPTIQTTTGGGGGGGGYRRPTKVETKTETAPAGTDWVKLGLQLGAAYLLLS
jgi:hypothetical protein